QPRLLCWRCCSVPGAACFSRPFLWPIFAAKWSASLDSRRRWTSKVAKLERTQTWLSRTDTPAEVSIPPGLSALEPVGCRTLFFRGQKVTLICFRRSGTRLAHLLVLDHLALRSLRADGAPIFAQDGEWMTAAWRKKGRTYLLAAQGDRALLERYLQGSSP